MHRQFVSRYGSHSYRDTIAEVLVSTALLLNEVSEKKSRNLNVVFEIFSEIFSEICPEVRPEMFRAFLAGRKVLPQNFTRFFLFPSGNFKLQIEFQSKFHQKFHKHTSAGLATLSTRVGSR